MSNKIWFIVTINDKYDKKLIRDYVLDRLRTFDFINHVRTSFGVFSGDVSRDFEQERIYEKIPKEVYESGLEKIELEDWRNELQDELEKVDQKISLDY
jgi:hypothetical protein